MRFALLAQPGSDPGEARGRAAAVVAVDGAAAVAEAARATDVPYLLVLAAGARPMPGAFGGVHVALDARPGVLGGVTHVAGVRCYGWMLAEDLLGPLPFELAQVVAPLGEAGMDALLRGPIDVVAPGMLIAARELLLEPLPHDPVAALVELAARARAAGMPVVSQPSFACQAPPFDADDRGRAAALRALAERRPELRGGPRLPAGLRRVAVEREVRLEEGRRVRVRIPRPPVTVLVYGPGAEAAAVRARGLAASVTAVRTVADPVAALRAELRIRGDRHVLVAEAAALPSAESLDQLVEALESAPYVALAAPSAAALAGRCVLIAAGRFPQHVTPDGTTLADGIATLTRAAGTLRRAVHAPGHEPPVVAPRRPPSATVVFLAGSIPEITRASLDAVFSAMRAGDDAVAVCAANGETTRRVLGAHPQLRVELDDGDPILTRGANHAIAAASGEIVVLIADDVIVPPGALDRLRDAFVRRPDLGAAFPSVAGAAGPEAAVDATYADVAQMRVLAARREQLYAREAEPIDVACTPAVAVAREAFNAVGGIDPTYGPTRAGIAGLVTRLRAAGYAVVRCGDTLAHRFDAAISRNPAAVADATQPVPVADSAAAARGFDPQTRVPFEPVAVPTPAATLSHVVALPIAGPAELERAAAFLAVAAATFDASAPVRLDVLLDGVVGASEAAARVRPVLAGSGRPMESTVAVRIERAPDLTAWRASLDPGVRLSVVRGLERDAFAGVPTVTASQVDRLLETVAR